jgi:hypothetical protein
MTEVKQLQEYIENESGFKLNRPTDMGNYTWTALSKYIVQLKAERDQLQTLANYYESELLKNNIDIIRLENRNDRFEETS